MEGMIVWVVAGVPCLLQRWGQPRPLPHTPPAGEEQNGEGGERNENPNARNTTPNIQLDSYPGANMYHFWKICEKSIPNPSIKIVVLSVGINNKDQDPRQTSCKQLRSLYKQAQLAFPNADIYFPIVNFSDKKLKEHFENTSDLNVKKYYVGYLYWYGQFNVLGTKGCHIFWWK